MNGPLDPKLHNIKPPSRNNFKIRFQKISSNLAHLKHQAKLHAAKPLYKVQKPYTCYSTLVTVLIPVQKFPFDIVSGCHATLPQRVLLEEELRASFERVHSDTNLPNKLSDILIENSTRVNDKKGEIKRNVHLRVITTST